MLDVPCLEHNTRVSRETIVSRDATRCTISRHTCKLQLITKGRQRKSYKQKLSDAAKSYREIGSILAVALERSRSAQIPNVQKGVRAQTNLSNASSTSKRSESSIFVPTILKVASPTRGRPQQVKNRAFGFSPQ